MCAPVQKLLNLLDKLDESNIHYQLDHLRADAITVFFTLVGARVEVDFSSTTMTYSVYRGHEDVETDTGRLMALVDGID